jgi:hypothetical protein
MIVVGCRLRVVGRENKNARLVGRAVLYVIDMTFAMT